MIKQAENHLNEMTGAGRPSIWKMNRVIDHDATK